MPPYMAKIHRWQQTQGMHVLASWCKTTSPTYRITIWHRGRMEICPFTQSHHHHPSPITQIQWSPHLPSKLVSLIINKNICRTNLGAQVVPNPRHETTDCFQIRKGIHQVCILSPCYLTYMQNTSCKMPGWMKHKLESRLLGEISITSDMQMTLHLCQKVKKN